MNEVNVIWYYLNMLHKDDYKFCMTLLRAKEYQ
jgi:hypothetical protein